MNNKMKLLDMYSKNLQLINNKKKIKFKSMNFNNKKKTDEYYGDTLLDSKDRKRNAVISSISIKNSNQMNLSKKIKF